MGGTRGAVRRLLAVVVLAPLLLSSACARELDRTQALETALVRLDGVDEATVRPGSDDRVARLELVLGAGLRPHDIAVLVGEVTVAAHEQGFSGYRVDLRRADLAEDVLQLHDPVPGRALRTLLATTWVAVGNAVLGDVTYSYQDKDESISIVSGAAVLHDVTEAHRIGHGSRDTTWLFETGPSALVVRGRVTSGDVEVFQRVQRTVGSTVLPLAADSWLLERGHSRLVLALQVGLGRAAREPFLLTPSRYDDQMRPLALAALDSVRGGDRPVWLELRGAPDDLFGLWVSDQRPLPGRDALGRGWDRWLQRVARP